MSQPPEMEMFTLLFAHPIRGYTQEKGTIPIPESLLFSIRMETFFLNGVKNTLPHRMDYGLALVMK